MAAVLKTANRGDSVRGFESHALRADLHRRSFDLVKRPIRVLVGLSGNVPLVLTVDKCPGGYLGARRLVVQLGGYETGLSVQAIS